MLLNKADAMAVPCAYGATHPLLSQAFVALGEVPGWWQKGTEYPMDYYAADGGEWNSSWHKKRPGTGGGGVAAAKAALAARAAASVASPTPWPPL